MSNRRLVAYTWMTAALLACDADTRPLGPGRDLPQPVFQTITQPTITVTLTPTSSDQGLPRDSVVAYKDLTLATVRVTGLLQISYSSAPGWGSNAGQLIGPWDAGGKVGGDLTCSGNVYVGIGGAFLGLSRGSTKAGGECAEPRQHGTAIWVEKHRSVSLREESRMRPWAAPLHAG